MRAKEVSPFRKIAVGSCRVDIEDRIAALSAERGTAVVWCNLFGEYWLYEYPTPSKVPHHFMDTSRVGGILGEPRIAWRGRLIQFSARQRYLDQRSAYSGDR